MEWTTSSLDRRDFSSGQALKAMERVAEKTLADGYGYDWPGLSFQERRTGDQVPFLFVLALLFAYLFLVGQYESWTIPLPVVLSVSVAMLGAFCSIPVTPGEGVAQRPTGLGS